MPGDQQGEEGSPGELGEVLGRLADQTKRFAVSRGLGKADAEDVSQDLAFKLFLKKGADPAFLDYEHVAAPLGTTAARRKILDHRRDRTLRDERHDQYETERSEVTLRNDNPGARVELKELFEAFGRALNAMSAELRETWMRRKMDGLSYEEIAAERGITVHAVNQNIVRAGHQLRAVLKDHRE
jgi:RNA polymerase sigma factor (sigma-70 family)